MKADVRIPRLCSLEIGVEFDDHVKIARNLSLSWLIADLCSDTNQVLTMEYFLVLYKYN